MKEKIYRFLLEHGGSAPSLALARRFLKIHSGSLAAAEQLLQSLLGDDPQFTRDGLGNWYINPEAREKPAEDAVQGEFRVATVVADQRSPASARHVQIGVVRVAELAITGERAFRFDLQQDPQVLRAAWQGLLAEDATGAIWVLANPSRLQAALRAIAARLRIEVPARWEVNLLYLAQQVLELPRRPDIAALCKRLGVRAYEDGDVLPAARSQAEILLHLLERLAQRGPIARQDFLQLGARPAREPRFQQTSFSEQDIRSLPDMPGVYLMLNAAGEVLYIGKAKSLRQRLAQYFLHPDMEDPKLRRILGEVRHLEWEILDTELDALIREAELIGKLKPVINVQREVRQFSIPQKGESCRIVILLSGAQSRAVVYVFSPAGDFHRVVCSHRRLPEKKLFRLIEDTCYGAEKGAGAQAAKSVQACEMAWRWFYRHRDSVNWLDAADYSSAGECTRNLLLLLADFSKLHERSVMQGE